jgi:hypothetical protein
VRADITSPYFDGLSEVLTRAFGVPYVVAEALRPIEGITEAFIFGSWAAHRSGASGRRPVEDIDLLILGEADRRSVHEAIEPVQARLGRPVQITFRSADWLAAGEGSFHDTVVSRPMVPVQLVRSVSG